jgi:hypothetical protein
VLLVPIGGGCVLSPKILIEWHAIESGGMASAELGNRWSIRLSYGITWYGRRVIHALSENGCQGKEDYHA